MKNTLLIICLLTIPFATLSQKRSPNKFRKHSKNYFTQRSPTKYHSANQNFSIGLNYGLNGGISSSYIISIASSNALFLKNRYIFNPHLALQLNIGFDRFNTKNGSSTLSNFASSSIEIAYDLGEILDFKSVNYDLYIQRSSFQLFVHAGPGIASMWNKDFYSSSATDPFFKSHDDIVNFNFGVTPELRLNKRFSLNIDFSFMFNFLQDRTFNYAIQNPSLNSKMYSVVFGMNYFY